MCSSACRPCARKRRGACLWAVRAARSRPRLNVERPLVERVIACGKTHNFRPDEVKRRNRAVYAHVSWFDRVCLTSHVKQQKGARAECGRYFGALRVARTLSYFRSTFHCMWTLRSARGHVCRWDSNDHGFCIKPLSLHEGAGLHVGITQS